MSYPTRLEDLLDEGRTAVRSLVRIAMSSGTYGFWTGNYDLVWDGVTFKPNQVTEIEEPTYAAGMAASDFKIRLPASTDFGVTPDILATIETLPYKGALVTLYEADFDPDDRALLHVEPLAYGYIDTLDHERDKGEKQLVINIVSGAVDNHRDGYRTASHEDQQLVSPGDRGLEFAGKVQTEHFDIQIR